MAHYDCSNCGTRGGIDFGYCSHCTPQEFGEVEQELRDLNSAARRAADAAYAEEEEALKRQKEDFVKAFTEKAAKPLRARLHELRREHEYSYAQSKACKTYMENNQ